MFELDGIEIEEEKDRETALRMFFHCSFRSSTLSLPAPPLQVTPQKLSPPKPYIPRLPPYPSIVHLQLLLALTLTLNLNHIPCSHTPLALRETGF